MEHGVLKAALADKIEAFRSFDLDSLNWEDLPNFSFRPISESGKSLQQIIKNNDFTDAIEDLEVETLKKLVALLSEWIELAVLIKEFPTAPDKDLYTKILDSSRRVFSQLESEFKKLLPTEYSGVELPVIEALIDAKLAQYGLTNLIHHANRLQEGKELVEELQGKKDELIRKVVLGTESTIFGQQAKKHIKLSRWWFGSTVLFVIILFYYVIFCFQNPVQFYAKELITPDHPQGSIYLYHLYEWPFIVAYFLHHLLLASIPLFGVTFSARMFKAERHNSIVQQHKTNVLAAYEEIVKAIDINFREEAVRMALKAICESPDTGLTKSVASNTPQTPINSIVEIVEKLGPK